MPEIVWACRLIQQEDVWLPQAHAIMDALGPHETEWSTTPGNRTAPYAVGASSVSAAQLAALQAEPAVHLFQDADWTKTFGGLPGPVRNRINTFCTQVGVAQPETNEVLRDLLTRMTQIIDQKSIDTHVERMRARVVQRAKDVRP